MDLNPDQLTNAALRLPPAERARLAEALLVSLEEDEPSWDAAWLAEAERRTKAADSDPDSVRPAAVAIAELRAKYSAGTDTEP